MAHKDLLGFLSIALTFAGYVPYFHSIFKRRTKPHMFTWLTWALINLIAFAGQFVSGAGAGSWSIGASFFLCLTVAVLSPVLGKINATRSDWLAFGVALSAIPLWVITKDPLSALILIALINVVGGFPTFRKTYDDPFSESLSAWSIYTVRSTVVLFAVEVYSLATLIIPLTALAINAGLVLLLVWRREACKKEIDRRGFFRGLSPYL